jgi:hypothetical protein
VANEGTRNGEPLALASREVLAACLDYGIEPLVLALYEVRGLRKLKRAPKVLVCCVGIAPAEVRADGT